MSNYVSDPDLLSELNSQNTSNKSAYVNDPSILKELNSDTETTPWEKIKNVGVGVGKSVQDTIKGLYNLPDTNIYTRVAADFLEDIAPLSPPNPLQKKLDQFVNNITNYDIGNKFGLTSPNDRKEQNQAELVTNFLPWGVGALKVGSAIGDIARVRKLSELNKLNDYVNNEVAGAVKNTIASSSKPLDSQQMTDQAVKRIKDFGDFSKAQADGNYAQLSEYLNGENNPVDYSKYVLGNNQNPVSIKTNYGDFGQLPISRDLVSQLLKSSGNSLKIPESSDLVSDQLPHIFDEDLRTNMSKNAPNTKALYEKFLRNPSGQNLLNLRSQLGSDKSFTPLNASDRAFKYQSSRGFDIADKLLKDHLISNDPSGNALKLFTDANHILSTQYYPLIRNSLTNSIMNDRVAPGKLSPQKFVNTINSYNLKQNGIPLDHFATQEANRVSDQLDKEALESKIQKTQETTSKAATKQFYANQKASQKPSIVGNAAKGVGKTLLKGAGGAASVLGILGLEHELKKYF